MKKNSILFITLILVLVLLVLNYTNNYCNVKTSINHLKKTASFASKFNSLIKLLSNASDEQQLIDSDVLISTIR